jgi:hypothetical protein
MLSLAAYFDYTTITTTTITTIADGNEHQPNLDENYIMFVELIYATVESTLPYDTFFSYEISSYRERSFLKAAFSLYTTSLPQKNSI